MVKISKEKQNRIMTNIISTLYQNSPNALFTSEISRIEIRDEEFIKKLLLELKEKKLVVEVKKSPQGKPYSTWSRWRLSNAAFDAYKKLY